MVSMGDEEGGKLVYNRYKDAQKGVIEKQLVLRNAVMLATGKSEQEAWIMERAWKKWSEEFLEVRDDEDKDEERSMYGSDDSESEGGCDL